jgi:hypothetical protein
MSYHRNDDSANYRGKDDRKKQSELIDEYKSDIRTLKAMQEILRDNDDQAIRIEIPLQNGSIVHWVERNGFVRNLLQDEQTEIEHLLNKSISNMKPGMDSIPRGEKPYRERPFVGGGTIPNSAQLDPPQPADE